MGEQFKILAERKFIAKLFHLFCSYSARHTTQLTNKKPENSIGENLRNDTRIKIEVSKVFQFAFHGKFSFSHDEVLFKIKIALLDFKRERAVTARRRYISSSPRELTQVEQLNWAKILEMEWNQQEERWHCRFDTDKYFRKHFNDSRVLYFELFLRCIIYLSLDLTCSMPTYYSRLAQFYLYIYFFIIIRLLLHPHRQKRKIVRPQLQKYFPKFILNSEHLRKKEAENENAKSTQAKRKIWRFSYVDSTESRVELFAIIALLTTSVGEWAKLKLKLKLDGIYLG